MKKQSWKAYVFWILLSEAVGLLAALLTRQGVEAYGTDIVSAPLSPPAIVFPIVWTILYALMGIGAARIYLAPSSEDRTVGLWVFGLQLVFNFFWSLIFFNAKNFALAFYWILALWVLILWMILTFRKVDRTAARLQIPYLLWVTFAAYLTWAVWMLNG